METNKIILNGITLPKGTEAKVSVEDGATIITFQNQESDGNKFKKGDIIYIEGIYDYHDFINNGKSIIILIINKLIVEFNLFNKMAKFVRKCHHFGD